MTVIIEQGSLQGIHYKTLASNKPYVSFLGIPYAKPPVGNLRFKVGHCLIFKYRIRYIIIIIYA